MTRTKAVNLETKNPETKNTVPGQAMSELERIIRSLDPDDQGLFALTEAYAQFWLMDLEDGEPLDPFETESRLAIQPIFGVLADPPASLDQGWRLAG